MFLCQLVLLTDPFLRAFCDLGTDVERLPLGGILPRYIVT